MRIPIYTKIKSRMGEYVIDYKQSPMPETAAPATAPHSVSLRARNSLDIRVRLRRFFNVDSDRIEAYIKRQQTLVGFQAQPHPSLLWVTDYVRDGSSVAVAFWDYEEDLPALISRRQQLGKPLSPTEMLHVIRQLVAALAVLHPQNIAHGRICLENIVYSRNGQNQLVFRIGDLRDEDLFDKKADEKSDKMTDEKDKKDGKDEKVDEKEKLQKRFATDMLDLGIAIYQLMTLNKNKIDSKNEKTLDKIRARLDKQSTTASSNLIKALCSIVHHMIAKDPTKRPIPKNVQIELAALNPAGETFAKAFEPSIANELIVPAGSGDLIVKRAQLGEREAQYQLALLLRERGHGAQTAAWNTKAIEQNHMSGERLAAVLAINGEGGPIDLTKAEAHLRKAAEAKDPEAQVLLGNLLRDRGDFAGAAQFYKAGTSASAEAQAELGLLLLFGPPGVQKDKKNALILLQQAAQRGNAIAQFFYGCNFIKREGAQDKKQAKKSSKKSSKWLEKAAEHIDMYRSLRDERTALAGAMALSNDTASTSRFIPRFLLKPTTKEAVDQPFQRIERRLQSDGKEENVEVKPFPESRYSMEYKQRLDRVPQHPHLLPIYGYCGDFTTSYPLNPLTSIVPMMRAISKGESAKFLLPWALQLASAIEALHAQDLVHCNISAKTIFINNKQQAVLGGFDDLCYRQEFPEVRVYRDVGKRVNRHLPPESSYSTANDIFAFGLTLLELATDGQQPSYDWTTSLPDADVIQALPGYNYAELVEQHYPASAPKELRELILQCLNIDFTKRPTAHQLVEALAKLAGTKPVHASERKSDGHSKSLYAKALHAKAMKMWAKNPRYAFGLLREAALDSGCKEWQVSVAEMLYIGDQVPQDLDEAMRFFNKAAIGYGVNVNELLYKFAMDILANKQPVYTDTALELLIKAANAGHANAQQRAAEILLSETAQIIPNDKKAALQFCITAASSSHCNPANKERFKALIEYFTKETQEVVFDQKAIPPGGGSGPQPSSAESLRLAFQYFFGLDVLRNLELSREFLVKAADGKTSESNTHLARAILSLSSNPLNEKCPLRFFVPGDDFQPPFVQLETTVYRMQGRAYRCSIVGRIAVLLAPDGRQDLVAMLNRCAHAHPNVIGPIGITANVKAQSVGSRDTLPIALLYAPVQAAPANRGMISDPTTATSRLLPFLVGIAEGLAHLHRSQVVHGNVSLEYMLVGHDRLGLIATGPYTCLRASAPESLNSGLYSTASDVFQFGMTIMQMLTGGTWEDAWLPQTSEVDSKTRLARLTSLAATNFANVRARIPRWCPAPLVDIMFRCLQLDRSKRPAMDTVATDLQTLRSTLAHAAAAAVGPRPAQFWMHTSHICLELTADEPMLRRGGIIECLYGSRIRDRLLQSLNRSTKRCKTIQGKQTPGVMHSKSFGTTTGPSSVLAYPNLAAGTRKIIEYKARFFIQTVLSSWDGSEVLPRGIRHFPSFARGAMLLDDKRLAAFVHRLDNPPNYIKDKVWCTGEADKCKCERAARPKNPKFVSRDHMPADVMRKIMSFLEMSDYGALAAANKFAYEIAEGNMNYWRYIIGEYGNQGQTYIQVNEILQMKTKPKFKMKNEHIDEMLRRWAKTIATKELYTRAYISLQLETTDVLHIPDITREERKHLIDKAHHEYKEKKHACAIRKPIVPPLDQKVTPLDQKKMFAPCARPVLYSQHFSNDLTKAVGGPLMACSDCLVHQVWSKDEALILWGFTYKQLAEVPFWRFSTSKRFSTADLLTYRMAAPMLKRLKKPKSIDFEIWNRYKDLPEYVRHFVVVTPQPPGLPALADAISDPHHDYTLTQIQEELSPVTKEPTEAEIEEAQRSISGVGISAQESKVTEVQPESGDGAAARKRSREEGSASINPIKRSKPQPPTHQLADQQAEQADMKNEDASMSMEASSGAPAVINGSVDIITNGSSPHVIVPPIASSESASVNATVSVISPVMYTIFYYKKPAEATKTAASALEHDPLSEQGEQLSQFGASQ